MAIKFKDGRMVIEKKAKQEETKTAQPEVQAQPVQQPASSPAVADAQASVQAQPASAEPAVQPAPAQPVQQPVQPIPQPIAQAQPAPASPQPAAQPRPQYVQYEAQPEPEVYDTVQETVRLEIGTVAGVISVPGINIDDVDRIFATILDAIERRHRILNVGVHNIVVDKIVDYYITPEVD